MANKSLNNNAKHLEKELEWLVSIIENRLKSFSGNKPVGTLRLKPPVPEGPDSIYHQFVESFKLNHEERLILLLALLPYVSPYLLEKAITNAGLESRQIPDLGGVKGSMHGGFIPTGETAIFLIAGHDLQKRFECMLYFSPRHKFYQKNILQLEETLSYEPETSGVLTISKDVLFMLTNATSYQPLFNSNFPAKLLTTRYDPDALVVAKETESHLDEISIWLKYKDKLMKEWGFENKIQNGYKCLFFGPPGTGKSLATALIGKQHDMPVYRIDLSMVISKFIGETEKNLSKIFDAANHKNWILFFDEADALFGKRSNIQNSNDRFANQEVSYLLMRMEEYEGLAILATNFRSNIDKAFLRRFQSIVHFAAPDKTQRLRLWEQSFSESTKRSGDVDLTALADHFSLTGAGIMNVVQYASLMALRKGNNIITKENLMTGIKKELTKESTFSGEGIQS